MKSKIIMDKKALNESVKDPLQKTNKNNSNPRDTQFYELFVEELQDIYWAEQHLKTALLKLQEAADNQKLAIVIKEHTEETENHIDRLKQIFELLEEKATAKKCHAMQGIIEEAHNFLNKKNINPHVREAGIILAAQRAEHYEIAVYGTLATWATQMGHEKVSSLLEATLEEEKKTDIRLTKLAEDYINQEAAEI